MRKNKTLTLADLKVQAVKANWKMKRRSKVGEVGFDAWFNFFNKDEVSYSGIAKEVDISRAQVWQVYNNHFKTLFEGDDFTPNQRNKPRKRITQHPGVNPTVLSFLMVKAKESGCSFKRVSVDYLIEGKDFIPMNSCYLIQGQLCDVHVITESVGAESSASYFFNVKRDILNICKFTVVQIWREKHTLVTLILPNEELKREHPRDARSTQRRVAIPVLQRDRFHRIQFWQYAEAWQLLQIQHKRT